MKKAIAIILLLTAIAFTLSTIGCSPKYGCSANKGMAGYR